MTAIRFTNQAHTFGDIDLDDGRTISGPLPPNDGEALAIYSAFLADGGVIAAFRRFASIEAARAALVSEVEARSTALRVAVAGTADASKLATYQIKYETAVRAIEGDAAALVALEPEADARGETPIALAQLVKSLGDQWRAAGLAIDAAYQTHKAAIAALESFEACEAYDLDAFWPELG